MRNNLYALLHPFKVYTWMSCAVVPVNYHQSHDIEYSYLNLTFDCVDIVFYAMLVADSLRVDVHVLYLLSLICGHNTSKVVAFNHLKCGWCD